MIDREKVIERIHEAIDMGVCVDLFMDVLELLKEQEAKIEKLIGFINGFSKDAVPVIRCKDCKHSCDYTDIFPDRAYKCIKNGRFHNESWYCADGERG